MKRDFGITLRAFEGLDEEPDPSIEKSIDFFCSLDPVALSCISSMANAAKSAAIAMCLATDSLSIEEAVRAARVDEDFQVSHFGLVEGAHDLDETTTYGAFATAKTVINLAKLRDV